jgi:hypothetical protein
MTTLPRTALTKKGSRLAAFSTQCRRGRLRYSLLHAIPVFTGTRIDFDLVTGGYEQWNR